MENDQASEELWNEVAAERSGDPVEKPSVPEPKESQVIEQKQGEAKAEPEAAKPTTEELLQQAIQRVEKLEGRTRNVEGHIGGLSNQNRALAERIAAAQSAAKSVSDSPTSEQIKKAVANPEQWEALKSDFPEWSSATEKFIDHKLSSVASVDAAKVNELVSRAIDSARTNITQEVEKRIVDKSLSAVFPGWKQDVSSDSFKQWSQSQPEEIRALAASDEVGDAAKMLSLYRESLKTNPVRQIQEARQQKLGQAVAAPRGTRSTPAKSWDDMTPEERWNSVSRERTRA